MLTRHQRASLPAPGGAGTLAAMSSPTTTRATRESSYVEDDQGYGWVMFAGVLLMILGIMNIVYGIAAIDSANFFVAGDRYVFGDLSTYGWILAGIGAAQILVGFGVFAKNQLARWAGVFCLGVNMITHMLAIQAYPAWSLMIIAIDVVAMYGLLAYGRRLGAG
jgi:hypothetical protein